MKSPTGSVSVRTSSGDSRCDHGGNRDANQTGDQVNRVKIPMTEEQLRRFVGTRDRRDHQGGDQRIATGAGQVGEQGQHAK
jgi:hypothetical protein